MAEMRRDKLYIYVPQEKLKEKPIERLMKLAKDKDRSVNYLVVQAILEFVKREEKEERAVSGPHGLPRPPKQPKNREE
jgi:hypothetical protein